jgi:hypothetical protein
MFISITALLCTAAHLCVEEIVTDSSIHEGLTMQSCLLGEAAVVDWMSKHPIYSKGYTLQKWGCTLGNKRPQANKHDRA